MIVLSHLKGHELSGFGGSIKNVAMGCVTKESKAAQHRVNRGVIDLSKCTGCGQCVEACAFKALSLLEEKIMRDERNAGIVIIAFIFARRRFFPYLPRLRRDFKFIWLTLPPGC